MTISPVRIVLALVVLVLGTVALHYISQASWLLSALVTTLIFLAGVGTTWLTGRLNSR